MKMQTKMLFVTAVVGILMAPGVDAAPQPREISHEDLLAGRAVIVGELGMPLGTYVTIEGLRPEQGVKSNNPLTVDTVDGKKLRTPVVLEINGIQELPRGVRCVLRGYETGAMESAPPDPLAKPGAAPQQDYHFAVWFLVSQIREPATLEKK